MRLGTSFKMAANQTGIGGTDRTEPNRGEPIEQSEPDEPECIEPGNPETEANRNEPGLSCIHVEV